MPWTSGNVVPLMAAAASMRVLFSASLRSSRRRSSSSSRAGTQRQYTGTAGRIENAQVAVYLTYAGEAGHAMIDRELYLPRCWTNDPARCAAAGIPQEVEFATKPALAQAMIGRALDAGVPTRWVAADEVYGADPNLRAELQGRRVGYVLAIGCDRRVPTAAGPMRPDTLATSVPKGAWARLSAGPGAKGQRYYDWAWVTLTTESGHHGCSSAATPATVNSPFTAVTHPPWSPSASWSASPDADGPSKKASRPPKASPDSTSTNSAAGCHGDAGRCSRCSPTPCSRSSPRPNAPNTHHSPPAHRHIGLVTLATPPPTPSPCQPLPPPTNPAHMITIYGWSTR